MLSTFELLSIVPDKYQINAQEVTPYAIFRTMQHFYK